MATARKAGPLTASRMCTLRAVILWAEKWARRYAKGRTRVNPRWPRYKRVWIDVGAHEGELTLVPAMVHRSLLVYAFEANPAKAEALTGRRRNYMVLPFAVSETDGVADFHVNAFAASSSLLPLDAEEVKRWQGGDVLSEVATIRVPTVRLDTFMDACGIEYVEWLKIDAQGADLAVLRSAGDRLSRVERVTVEAVVADCHVYKGDATKEEIVEYLTAHGFRLLAAEAQAFGQEENLTFGRS